MIKIPGRSEQCEFSFWPKLLDVSVQRKCYHQGVISAEKLMKGGERVRMVDLVMGWRLVHLFRSEHGLVLDVALEFREVIKKNLG